MKLRVAVTVLLALAAARNVSAQGRQLGVAVRGDVAAARARIEAALPPSWPGLQPGALFSDLGIRVLATEELTAAEAADLFTLAAALEAGDPDVLAAGEVYPGSGVPARLYSGRVRVHLSRASDELLVTQWAQARGLTVERTNTRRLHMLLGAPLDAAQLLQVLVQVPSPGGPAEPVFFDFAGLKPLGSQEVGGYHLLPGALSTLAVVLQQGAPPGEHLRILRDGGATVVDTGDADPADDVHFAEFGSETEMLEGMKLLQAEPATVRLTGPTISQNPPRFITAELIVDFVDARALDAAHAILAFYDLVEVREIPYLDHGYMFRRVVDNEPEPSYVLYEAGARLLDARLATLAVPNVITENGALCQGLDCTPRSSQAYFDQIHLGGAWEVADLYPRETVIGLLDDGFSAGSPQCDQLNVAAMLDSKYCDPRYLRPGR